MKFSLPLLSTFSLATAAGRNPSIAAKPEEIQSLIDHARKTVELHTQVATPTGRMHESDACRADEMTYYDPGSSPIASTFLPPLIFSGAVSAPGFDMDALFNAVNFDSECATLGGEVYEVDIELKCANAGLDIVLEGFKLCKPPSCDEFMYAVGQKMMLYAVGSNLGCESNEVTTGIDDKIPSMMCIMDIDTMMNNTEIASMSPEAFLMDGGAEYINTETSTCRNYGKSGGDVAVCDMRELEDLYSNITSMCEGFGAEIYPLDIRFTASRIHRTFKSYPFCKASACDESDVNNYYAWMSEMLSGVEHTGNSTGNVTIEFKKSVENSCEEALTANAFMKEKAGKVLVKTCNWLKKRPSQKEKICSKTSGKGGFGPASEVCPSTCCACSEESDNVFLKRVFFKTDGQLSIQTATCAWLQNAPANVRNAKCNKSGASYVGGYPPASIACPETCGICSA